MGQEVVPGTVELAVKFDVTETAIAELKDKFKDVSFGTPTEYEVGRKAIATLRDIRVRVEKRRVDLKAPALKFGRDVDAAAKVLIGKIEEIEDPLQTAKKLVDDAAAKAKLDAERAELIALEAEQTRLRVEAEAKAKAEREAEEKRLADERAALEAEKARQAAANAEIERGQAAERERIAAERRKLEAEKAAVEEAARKGREADEQRARAAREEAARVQAARAAEEQAARLEALRPEREKVHAFADDIRRLAAKVPVVESDLCAGAVAWVKGRLQAVADKLDEFDGGSA